MQSKIAIPIISENYASSQWCLHELTLMLNCMRSGDQKVFPIFYKVEVWQVRNLGGRYGDAFNKWKNNLGGKVVEEWKEALRAVCSLRGWKSQNYENGYEGALVKTIVEEIRSELYGTSQLIKEGTCKIEALRFDEYGYKRSYKGEQFKELAHLRWLQWERCPSNFEAANFHPKKLVVLNLSWSEISEDWGGWDPLKMATQLKVLNLTGCLSLRNTPDLSAFESLEILILEECENLEMIHHSIMLVKSLISLNVNGCRRLEELPIGIGRMEQLRELLINDTAIREIPISKGSLKLLTQLDLSHSEIDKLPESMDSLESLTQLDLSYSYLEELPHSMGSLGLLTQLDLSHSGIRKFPESMGSLVSLIQLDLSYSRIEELPEPIGSLKKLETLNAFNCALLAHIHSSIGNLTFLSLLDLRKCHKLAQLPDSIDSMVSLQHLLLRGCLLLKEIPDSIGKLVSLTELDLKSTSIVELPQSIEKL
ncbi:hypothetical protein EUGRSUZ_C01600 [Eucalyptus grandis]|nr:hypothetical protein EUGRSUZ_C01600 [Eucalyptus grandis]